MPQYPTFQWHGCRKRLVISTIVVLLAAAVAMPSAVAAEACGSLEHQYGPYDYTDPADRAQKLRTVERRHFTVRIRRLEGGETASLGGDIAYTLKWYPNHHHALDAMARLAVREDTTRPRGSDFTVECWFERALRFRPDDAMVYLVRGLYHFRRSAFDEAIEHLRTAVDLEPDNPEVQYNLGLALARAGNYEAAIPHAERAYELGYPLPGLRNILREQGYALAE